MQVQVYVYHLFSWGYSRNIYTGKRSNPFVTLLYTISDRKGYLLILPLTPGHWQTRYPFHLHALNCLFLHDVTKIQTKKLSILLKFYFHDALQQLKTSFHTSIRFKRVLGFVIEYAWISKLLRDALFTWRPRELSCRLKKWLISGHFAIKTVHVLEKVLL